MEKKYFNVQQEGSRVMWRVRDLKITDAATEQEGSEAAEQSGTSHGQPAKARR